MKKYLWNKLALLGVGLLVSVGCLRVLFKTPRVDILLGFGFCVVLLVMISKDIHRLLRGKAFFSHTLELNVPCESTVVIPLAKPMLHGRVLLFFTQSTTLYWGKIVLSDSEQELAFTVLPKAEDRTSIFKSIPSRRFTKGPWHLVIPVPPRCTRGELKLKTVLNHNITEPAVRRKYGFKDVDKLEIQVRSTG